MRTGPIISLVFSIIVGVVAVFFGRAWLSNEAEATLPTDPVEVLVYEEVPTQTVVVATQPLKRGDPVSQDAFDLVEWPADFIPVGAMTDVDLLNTATSDTTFALGYIAQGEPLTAEKLSLELPRDTLPTIIEPGFRAVSIEVDDATGVSGFVLPGHFVDVILSRESFTRSGAKSYRAETLMQDVRVLAVDQNFADNLEGTSVARTVTLEVSPHQGAQLISSADAGRLGLALRAEEDRALAPVVTRRRRVVPPPPRRTTASVRIIEGDTQQTVTTPIAREGSAQ